MKRLQKSNKIDKNLQKNIVEQNSYSATTADISVTVWPEFIDSKASLNGEIFIWAYQILVENKRDDAVQIIKRAWKIIDEKGNIQEVKGNGVVGEQPIILPNSSYKYSSGVHLENPSGIMSGKYTVKKVENGETIEVEIPPFSLDVPSLQPTLN